MAKRRAQHPEKTALARRVPETKGRSPSGARRKSPLEDVFGSVFEPLHRGVARAIVGPQVDDIVTEAVKESYAAGVAAALVDVRVWARSHSFANPEFPERQAVSVEELDAELEVIRRRLSSWKTPPG